MNKSRRAFNTSGIAFASASFAWSRQANAASTAPPSISSARAAAFVKKIGLRYPIVQAAIGTGSSVELAAAVSEAGGLGGMGITWQPEANVRALVTRTRAATKAPFAVGYVLAFGANTMPIALEAGAPIVQFSWGTPTRQQAAMVRSFGAKIGMQISSLGGAKQALDLGVDYISVQGQEAGGHVQAQGSWRDQLGPILEAAGDVPVVVAGGLGDGKALREVLALGASGGVFGTRFVATKEASSHPEFKRRLVRSSASDTSLTVCFESGWTNALHRVLRNKTLDDWEAAGALPPGRRPGETDVVAQLDGKDVPRYFMRGPSALHTGNPTEMAMFAGLGVGAIKDIPGAGDLVRRIWAECVGVEV